MNKFHGIGLVVLLAVTFIMMESAYGLYTVDIDTASGGGELVQLDFSTQDSVVSNFGESFYEKTTKTMHVIWWDNIEPSSADDIVFYSSTTDGITKTTPIILYTGGGPPPVSQVSRVEIFASGNTVFTTWLVQEVSGLFSLFEKTSTDGGATFSVQWTVFANSTGVTSSSSMEMVGNSASDIVIAYRNSTSDTLEARVSHNNGVTWAFETLAGDLHGTGNADGFHSFNDASITMIGDTVDIAFTADFTDGVSCVATCNSLFHQQSTDAGDTWKTDALLITSTDVDHTTEDPFLFVSGSIINVLYFDIASSLFEQARSTNGGTSFSIEIDTGLTDDQTPFGNCARAPTLPIFIFQDWIAIGAGSNLAILCRDEGTIALTQELDFISSSNTGLTWSSVGSVATQFTIPDAPDTFQGYTNGTVGIVGFHGNPITEKNVIFSTDGLTTWSARTDEYTDGNSGTIVQNGQYGITDNRAILMYQDDISTDEVSSFSFRFPVECDPTANQNFTCPLDMSALTAGNSTFPSNMAGIGTKNGFFATWNQDVSGFERIMFGKTSDGITASTPVILSGTSATGQDEDQLFIFEDGGTLGFNIIDVFWRELDAVDSLSDLHHVRSTNGGTSFVFTQIEDNLVAFYPIVDGNTIYKFWIDGNTDILFGKSTNGGTSFGADLSIMGGGDECDAPQIPLKAIKDSAGTLHVAWVGEFTGNATKALCYNRSTDDGTSWSATVQILSDNVADKGVSSDTIFPFPTELEIFDDDSNTTVLWENIAEDAILQARSTDNGVSFGSREDVLITAGFACTDPSRIAVITNVGTNIYVACQASAGIDYLVSNNMGVSYSTQATMIPDTDPTSSQLSIAQTKGFSTTDTTFFLTRDNENKVPENALGFTNDNGVSFDTSNRTPNELFFGNEDIKLLTGNSTHLWAGFVRNNNGDPSQNAWVSLGTGFSATPPVNQPPVITITGDNPLEHLVGTTYTDAGAICNDPEDGSLTSSIVTVSTVNTALVGTYTVTYTCTDSGSLVDQEFRTVNVVEQITTTTTTGGGAGAPVGSVDIDTGIEGLTPAQILAFDQAVADAIASIEPSQGNIVETIIQTFFEFIVIDKVHEEIQLQSFLDNERLGFRWSTGDDLVVVSATPALSPFMFTFEQFPVVRQGSGAFVSTSFILYNLEVPRTECTVTISVNCVEKIRYEIPVTVNAIINGTQVSDTGTITVDLTEDEIDPILLIILSTAIIPFIAVIIQRSRGRSSVQPLRRLIS